MSRTLRLAILAAGISLALMLTACSAPKAAVQPTTTKNDSNTSGNVIVIKDKQFSPATMQVKTGAPVYWVNRDSVDHTVTFDSGPSSGQIKPTGQANHTFTDPGTFTYHCDNHKDMKGTVVVTP